MSKLRNYDMIPKNEIPVRHCLVGVHHFISYMEIMKDLKCAILALTSVRRQALVNNVLNTRKWAP